jgi:hypothetical protein
VPDDEVNALRLAAAADEAAEYWDAAESIRL